MGTHVASITPTWNQTTDNRTRSEAIEEIADYTGGGNRAVIQARALTAWKGAVREYNTVLWKFNRMIDDITLANNTQDYNLNSDFHMPLRAVLMESGNIERQSVRWVKFEEWTFFCADNKGTGGAPDYYTARNSHETGLVSVYPKVASPITYPTLRVHYFRRIAIPPDAGSRINCPMEVDEGIFQLAVAKHVAKEKGPSKAVEFYALAETIRARVEQQWRDWPDF